MNFELSQNGNFLSERGQCGVLIGCKISTVVGNDGWTQWNEETLQGRHVYGSCNDSQWWLAFIMHNLYTKLHEGRSIGEYTLFRPFPR